MWDLDTIHYMNDLAHYNSLKMVNDGLNVATPPGNNPEVKPVFPLAILSAKLITGPPSLVRLIDLLENSDYIADFLSLVREFIPLHEAEIMSHINDGDRIERFRYYFDYQYFPLSEQDSYYDEFTIGDFISQLPIDLMGFSSDDYENFDSFRDSYVLLLSLIENPFVGDIHNERLPILERVITLVGKQLVELIPHEGWSLDDIHSMLDGTEYEGCAAFADWVHNNTGFMQLDANYIDYGAEHWSRGLVDDLTEEWPRVVEHQQKMQKMWLWLEEDMFRNFKKLLSFMAGIEDDSVPKEQIPFPEEVMAIAR